MGCCGSSSSDELTADDEELPTDSPHNKKQDKPSTGNPDEQVSVSSYDISTLRDGVDDEVGTMKDTMIVTEHGHEPAYTPRMSTVPVDAEALLAGQMLVAPNGGDGTPQQIAEGDDDDEEDESRTVQSSTGGTSGFVMADDFGDEESEDEKALQAQGVPLKRVLFISLGMLNMSFENVPPFVLEHALFCFGCSRVVLFPKTKEDVRKARKSVVSKMNLSSELVECVREKDKQGLVLWLDPGFTSWQELSAQLESIDDLYRPTKDGDGSSYDKYKPLILDAEWWTDKYSKGEEHIVSKYGVKAEEVIQEIISPTLKFEPTRELLWHSNPSLIPMTAFDAAEWHREKRHAKIRASQAT